MSLTYLRPTIIIWVILLKLAHSWTEKILKIDFPVDKNFYYSHIVHHYRLSGQPVGHPNLFSFRNASKIKINVCAVVYVTFRHLKCYLKARNFIKTNV